MAPFAAFLASPCWPLQIVLALLALISVALIARAVDDRLARRRSIKRRLGWGR